MRRVLVAVGLVSTAAIAYEILLMRMLSIVQWHHFAWMVISLALLGYGASGTAIALGRRHLAPHFATAFSASALAFSVCMALCWAIGQHIPFNAFEIVWNPRQLVLLGLMYLLYMVPFFFAAACIGLAFTCRGQHVARIYRYDLLGAAAGAVLIISALFLVTPSRAVVLLAALALAASIIAMDASRVLRILQSAWLILLLLASPAGFLDLAPSEFKGQSQALQVTGSRQLLERSSPLGQIAVVESPRVPFRHAPGLSIATQHVPPDQLGVFVDNDGLSVITRWDGSPDSIAYLGDTTLALAYDLLEAPHVLVLGAGSGALVLQGLYFGASSIDAVELDPRVIELVREDYGEYAGQVYRHPKVRTHTGEARSFTARTDTKYDLVQIGLLDSFAVSGSGVQALNENYLYTVEAIREYLDRLRPGGFLSITRWLKIPPRDSLKLVAMAVEALAGQGVTEPGEHLAMIRNWNTVTLLLKNEPLTVSDVRGIREFASRRSFDTVYSPGLEFAEANRFNQLERAWFHEGTLALLGTGAKDFIQQYKFNIEPATDERPYFFNFFRWAALPELLRLRERGGASLIEWGYLVPLATLVQAAVVGSLLILLPLALTARRMRAKPKFPAGAYFFLLGLAFFFVEIAFIQKLTLFLGHPLYAITVVLAGFLVFAGLGSGFSLRMRQAAHPGRRSPVSLPTAGILIVSLIYVALLPVLLPYGMAWPDAARITTALLLIAPLAFFMGMPFPLGLQRLNEEAPEYVPWAWGINGFASVLSTALATLLAIRFGFTAVLLLALVLYLGAAACFRDWGNSRTRRRKSAQGG